MIEMLGLEGLLICRNRPSPAENNMQVNDTHTDTGTTADVFGLYQYLILYSQFCCLCDNAC